MQGRSHPILTRRVGLWGAVFLGLGSILGTGVFIALGLAAGLAGPWAMGALCLAAALATCNALSSAQLAADYPVSGGTYAYGRHYIHPRVGFVAGVCFLLAKSASASAAAIGVVSYSARIFGISIGFTGFWAAGFVLLITACVLLGLRRASWLNTAFIGITISALVTLMAAGFGHSTATAQTSTTFVAPSFFEAAALIFVAFTGYGRIATLGEEITAPKHTIPKAIIITVAISVVLYGGVLWTGLTVLGAEKYGREAISSGAPLETAALMLDRPLLSTFIAVAAVTAMAGVLLNLILGLSRVAFAMARDGELPRGLSRLSRGGEPQTAVIAVGSFIALIALSGGLALVWSFSAFTVLLYYSVTNWAALRMKKSARLYPRAISWAGLIGCLLLALFIDPKIIAAALVIIVAALIIRNIISPRPQ